MNHQLREMKEGGCLGCINEFDCLMKGEKPFLGHHPGCKRETLAELIKEHANAEVTAFAEELKNAPSMRLSTNYYKRGGQSE